MNTGKQYIKCYSEQITDHLAKNRRLTPFLMTIRYKPLSVGSITNRSQLIFSMSDRLYSHIISQLMNNHNRKPHLFPFAYNFLDVAGSKSWAGFNISNVTKFHLHCIYLVHSDTLVKFEKLVSENFNSVIKYRSATTGQFLFFPVESIHCKAIASSDVSLVVDYSAKLMKNSQFTSLMRHMTFFSQNPSSAPPSIYGVIAA